MARRRRLSLEVLEERIAPAVFGQPWALPRQLTLSFAPDGTSISGQPSALFGTLDATRTTAEWQRVLLRAVEAWAEPAGLDVGVVGDGGQPFGEPGMTQGDARFGDIRIAAVPMGPETLALSIPPDPYLSGTWAGDIILNQNVAANATDEELYAIALHEVAHALGLPETEATDSPRAAHPTAFVTQLSEADYAAVRALYGPRDTADARRSTAPTPIPVPQDFKGYTPLLAYGQITPRQPDALLSVRVPRNYCGPITFRLQAAGLSLLAPRLTVMDCQGHALGVDDVSESPGGTATVQLNGIRGGTTLYLRVEASDHAGTFQTGRYAVTASFDRLIRAHVEDIEAAVRGPFQSLSANQLAVLMLHPEDADLNQEENGGRSLATAQPLVTTPGFSEGLRYQVVGSLHDASDAMYYRLEVPAGASPAALTVALNALSVNGVAATVELLNDRGQVLATNVLMADGHAQTIQAGGLTPGATYYIRVGVPEGASEGRGNFILVADLLQTPGIVETFADGKITPARPETEATLYVARTQLFQFTLRARGVGGATNLADKVRMTITDADGRVVLELNARSGRSAVTRSILLTSGSYSVAFSTPDGGPSGPEGVKYVVTGTVISDPIGPIVHDPTYEPIYIYPLDPTLYLYPPGYISVLPYLWLNF